MCPLCHEVNALKRNKMELIGYYASFPGDRAIVNEDGSIIIFGNIDDFINYHENHPEKVTEKTDYQKIYYDEIMQSIHEGYSFAFDEFSYNRFYPIAQRNGHDFGPQNFLIGSNQNYEKRFVTLKIEPTRSAKQCTAKKKTAGKQNKAESAE